MTTFIRRPGGWDEIPSADYGAGMQSYQEFLGARDFSSAGDLLAYFGSDFFHDAGIELTLPDGESRIELRMTAHIDVVDEGNRREIEVPFLVELLDVRNFAVQLDSGGLDGLESFGYSEIDGLEQQIAAAQEAAGGIYHSLLMECPGGTASMIFRSARVTPVDPVLWMTVVRNPHARLAIVGLDSGSGLSV